MNSFGACSTSAFLAAAVHDGLQRDVPAHEQGADPHGGADLVPRDGQGRGPGRGEVHGHRPEGLDGVGVQRDPVVGREPADHLVEVTDKAHASLLVIGLRRRTSVGKFLLGSSASVILMHAPCPVLAVKAPGGEPRVHR